MKIAWRKYVILAWFAQLMMKLRSALSSLNISPQGGIELLKFFLDLKDTRRRLMSGALDVFWDK